MAKNYYSKSKTKRAVIAFLAAAALTCTGFASACANKTDENNTTALATKQEDTQLLKNGNFEFFDYPSDEYISDGKALYLIKTPDDWSRSGDSSNAMSGIIGTSASAWEALTASDLKGRLDYNAELTSSSDDYIDYNGLKSRDILYKDTYAALLSSSDVADSYIKNQGYKEYFGIVEIDGEEYFGAVQKADGSYDISSARKVGKKTAAEGEKEDIEYYFKNEDGTLSEQSVRFALINNPASHYNFVDENGASYYMDGDKKVTVYKDESGSYFYDEDLKYPCQNVLMVHNYPSNSNYNGIAQYYSSQSLTIEANTAAEISVWVKTSDLKFDKGYSQLDDQDRGAFIEVVQTVNGTSIDSFKIKAINTEKIIKNNPEAEQSNGWLKYTIYVNGCDFANSTVQINLGLGQSTTNSEKCTGYAFFDDVTVTKLLSLDEKDGDGNDKSSYNANADKITAANTVCTLTSDKDDKIFVADTDDRYHASDKTSPDYLRNSRDFYYLIDLASEHGSEGDNKYTAIQFGVGNTEGALTTEKSDGKLYASSTENSAMVFGIGASSYDNLNLPENLKESISTAGDLLGAFGTSGVASSNFNQSDYSKKLNDALTGDNGFDKLPAYTDGTSNMLVMLSARGAAYTSTVTDDGLFTLAHDERMILSFWVKTSDMDGSTALTVKVIDKDDDKNSATFSVDTTGKTTEFGDNEDIYNGWVQCFLFVENTSDEKVENGDDFVSKTFKIEFSFGNTSVASASASSFNFGWAAVANLQALKVTEKIYDLSTSGDNSAKFSFTGEDDEDENHPFAAVGGVSDIKAGIAKPDGYTGANGGSASVGGKDFSDAYNTDIANAYAGLINRDEFENYANWATILSDFTSETNAVAAWNAVFGEDCWQPLIIKSNLRYYAVSAGANEQSYKQYYVVAEDGYEGDVVSYGGKDYRKVGEDEEYTGKPEDYYKIEKAANYGYIGANKSVSADGYETVTVRVKVSENAVAYVYLVNNDTNEVLGYTVPTATFYYDNEGNVLNKEYSEDMTDDEHNAAIVYVPREDGLYDAVDGAVKGDTKVYANVNNLVRSYKYYKYEENKFYTDAECENEILFDDLVEGETYYSEKNKEADHFLCTADGTRIYEYADGKYYYLVEGARGLEVTPFDTEKAPLRYENESGLTYSAKVTYADCGSGWVTVNFFIHAGSEAVDYRLEVWNGERGASGVDADGNYVQGTVAFDYSAYSVTSSNFDGLREEYENKIIAAYKKTLTDEQFADVDPDKESIAYYQNLATAENVESVTAEYGYTAKYYTYTLYDSDTYQPFNAEVAKDGETGYSFNITDYEEKLAYFKYVNAEANSLNIFADYSAIEQSVERTTPEEPDKDESTGNESDANIWLYVASIVLVVALLITLISLLLRDFLKKNKRKKSDKSLQKNNYRQRKRYIRKLHLVENEEEAEEATAENAPETVEEVETAEETVTETPAEEAETTAETVEETATEATADTSESVEPAESSADAPTDGAETPADGDNSDNSEDNKPE